MEVTGHKNNILIIDEVFDGLQASQLIKKYERDENKIEPPEWMVRKAKTLCLSNPNWEEMVLNMIRPKINQVIQFFIDSIYPGLSAPDWLDFGFVMSGYKTGQECTLHMDGAHIEKREGKLYQRMASMSITLNEGQNDADGAMVFPAQDMIISSKCGRAICFPSSYTHPHRVLPVKTDRYVLIGWLYHTGEIEDQVNE